MEKQISDLQKAIQTWLKLTGIKPENLIDAFIHNRIVILPCNFGEKIYTIERNDDKQGQLDIYEFTVSAFQTDSHFPSIKDACYTSRIGWEEPYQKIAYPEIEDRLFCSREEAEKTLEKLQKEGSL